MSEKFLILRRIQVDMIINIHRSACTVIATLVPLYRILNFLDRFSKNREISNFMKIRPIGTESFHADRQTDGHEETNSRFSQFCESA